MSKLARTICSIIVSLVLTSAFCAVADTADINSPDTSTPAIQTQPAVQTQIEEKADEAEKMKELKEAGEAEKRKTLKEEKMLAAERKKAKQLAVIEKLILPEDTTPRLNVKEIQISGNTLLSTDALIASMPLVYNASKTALLKASPQDLYDLRTINEILTLPGQVREVSTRTIQGFIQYILSAYQDKNYGGIYVYVPRQALSEGTKLTDDILPIKVIEALVTSLRITAYDVNQTKRQQPLLKREIIEEWSPAKPGEALNKKRLNNFVNILNLNPDRYISATVSKGTEPNSLAVGYDIYETSPWHAYIQVDNSGTSDRRYKPRLGLINTNLTGRDDRLTLMAQIAPEHGIEDNYAVYGSYDVPLWTPRLRLTVFGGRSEFDTQAPGDISFLGNGSFYGGLLRLNVFQHRAWFFDLTGSLSEEKSKITPSLFPSVFGSDLKWQLWSVGAEIHHRDDLSQSNIAFNQYNSMNESSVSEFEKARPGSKPDFRIYTISGMHSQFIDPYKVHRINGSYRWMASNERLAPAKMTTFGGMYTVRGYKEDQIVADGGVIFSIQYEYDLVKSGERDQKKANLADVNAPMQAEKKNGWLKRLAPLCFIDGGQARIKDPMVGEKGAEDLLSVGIGLIGEVTEHYEAAVYLGWPLKDAGPTEKGKPRLNFSFIARW
jgi:hemolysin activation/secretion protein